MNIGGALYLPDIDIANPTKRPIPPGANQRSQKKQDEHHGNPTLGINSHPPPRLGHHGIHEVSLSADYDDMLDDIPLQTSKNSFGVDSSVIHGKLSSSSSPPSSSSPLPFDFSKLKHNHDIDDDHDDGNGTGQGYDSFLFNTTSKHNNRSINDTTTGNDSENDFIDSQFIPQMPKRW